MPDADGQDRDDGSLQDLPAEVIARLDAVCLQYEMMLSRGESTSIDNIVASNPTLPSRTLQRELELVRSEMLGEPTPAQAAYPQPKSDEGVRRIEDPIDRHRGRAIAEQGNRPDQKASGNSGRVDQDDATVASGGAATTSANRPNDSASESERASESEQAQDSGTGSAAAGAGLTRHADAEQRSAAVADGDSASERLPAAGDYRPPPPGEVIGPYEIESQIDRGGMGIVFRAIDTRLRRDVAIKVLAPHLARLEALVVRFDRESRAVAAISHPHIVELFDVGMHRKLPYAVMEYLRGDTLGTFLRRGPMSHWLVRRIAMQIASALATAHAAGVIHRDLKPGNIMLLRQSGGEIVSLEHAEDASDVVVPNVHCKLFDFGLSRWDGLAVATGDRSAAGRSSGDRSTSDRAGDATIAHDGDSDVAGQNSGDASVTRATVGDAASRADAGGRTDPVAGEHSAAEQTAADQTPPNSLPPNSLPPNSVPPNSLPIDETVQGTVMGTPGYMAPEQIHGDTATPAVDLFALGAILYECWTGRRAFEGGNRDERFASTLSDRPTIDAARRQADPTLATLIEKCLEKQIDRRPPSASVIVEDLRRTEPAIVAATSGAETASKTRRGWMIAAGASTVGLLGILAADAFLRRGRGSLAGGSSAGGSWSGGSVDGVKRLAVLSFDDTDDVGDDLQMDFADLSRAEPLSIGRKISTLLINELSRLPDLAVPAFRGVGAKTRQDYIRLGQDLGVDVLLDGDIEVERRGSESFLSWDLRLVDAATGDQLWGGRKTTPAADNLLSQTTVAKEIAAVIGRQLTPTAARDTPPRSDSFTCLIRGRARDDYDNTASLEMALRCFAKAAVEDPSFPDPIGGQAAVSMELAGRVDDADDVAFYLDQARVASEQVLKLDPTNTGGLLTKARLAWQMTSRFDVAESILSDLAMKRSGDPAVLNQWGRLQLVLGRHGSAIGSLRIASVLDPMSVLFRVDLAYARWVAGQKVRAVEDLQAIEQRRSHVWIRGLLIDIAEAAEQFKFAAGLDPGIDPVAGTSKAFYFPDRQPRLDDVPYGPFAGVCNRLIFAMRTSPSAAAEELIETLDPLPPMMIYLLATHPSLKPLRSMSRVKELLPPMA